MKPLPSETVAIYHCVYDDEDLTIAAEHIFELVREAEQDHPGKPRKLVVDINGHRDEDGGFDRDMLELQEQFMEFLIPYLTEFRVPLRDARNPQRQRNSIPERLDVLENRG